MSSGTSYWHPDASSQECELCFTPFTLLARRHHCRDCGGLFCSNCCRVKEVVSHRGFKSAARICDFCLPLVRSRLQKKKQAEQAALADARYFALSTAASPVYTEAAIERWVRLKREFDRISLRESVSVLRDEIAEVVDTPDNSPNGTQPCPPRAQYAPNRFEISSLFTPSSRTEVVLPFVFPLPLQADPLQLIREEFTPAPSYSRIRDSMKDAHQMAMHPPPDQDPLPTVVESIAKY